jgi:hypothetical protein
MEAAPIYGGWLHGRLIRVWSMGYERVEPLNEDGCKSELAEEAVKVVYWSST